jgi:hypothetical protein
VSSFAGYEWRHVLRLINHISVLSSQFLGCTPSEVVISSQSEIANVNSRTGIKQLTAINKKDGKYKPSVHGFY